MAIVRANQTVSVVDPTAKDSKGKLTGARTTIRVDQPFDSEDPLVKEYPWAFGSDDIERATAAPGEKRNVKR